MTLKEYNEKLEKVLRDTERNIGNSMVAIGSQALTAVRGRVQETGIDAEGEPFKPYSTKPMKAWCGTMTTDACSAAQSKYKRKKPKGSTKPLHSFTLKRGYEEFRELANRKTDITNFAFFNDMWNNISIISNKSQHDNGIVVIGAKDQLQKDKLSGNTARNKKKGGNEILDLSNDEISQLANDFKIDIVKIFKDNGL